MKRKEEVVPLCMVCGFDHTGECDPYGNGTLVPDDLWGTKPCVFAIDKDKPCGQKAGAPVHREPGLMRHDYRI